MLLSDAVKAKLPEGVPFPAAIKAAATEQTASVEDAPADSPVGESEQKD